MKYFATFNPSGGITGLFPSDIHPVPPQAAKEITASEYEKAKRGELVRDVTGGRWIDKPAYVPTLGETQAVKETEIRREGSRRLHAIAAPYSDEERESWHKQEKEARAWALANQTGADLPATPLLSAMATARGVPLADMVAKVMENVTLFEAASGHILGTQQALLDQVAAATTVAEVEAIGWPV